MRQRPTEQADPGQIGDREQESEQQRRTRADQVEDEKDLTDAKAALEEPGSRRWSEIKAKRGL